MKPRAAWLGSFAGRRLALAGGLAVIFWGALVVRFHHPVYGFTRFLQFDAAAEAGALPEMRAHPVFVYRDTGGYDGQYYAQLALHPDLRSPALPDAIDNLRFRARRILGSALAWVLALGDAERIPRVYAVLNLAAWLALAPLLWVLLPVRDARGWVAWAALLFSAGALVSVRLALTDLPALLALALAWRTLERGGARGAVGWLAAASLVRETSLAAVVAWWERPGLAPRTWLRPAACALAAAAPLAAWIAYVRCVAPAGGEGAAGLAWPFAGLVAKVGELAAPGSGSAGGWLALTTALAFAGTLAQALWFVVRPRPADRVWRLGAAFVALSLVLGTAVWEGHPGAASRVLLPLTFAFALDAARGRMPWAWLLCGALPVLAGIEALRTVPHDPTEISAGRGARAAWVARGTAGFFPAERRGTETWAWSRGTSRLVVRTWSAAPGPARVRLELRSLDARELSVRSAGRELWRGPCDPRWQSVEFAVPALAADGVELEIVSDAPPVREHAGTDARALAWVVRRVALLPAE